jgi:L-iditol 2-dehydrogenase
MKMNSIIGSSAQGVVGQLVRYHRPPESRSTQVRAAIWNGPGSMAVGSAPDAICPEDGVLLQVLACGVCGTDVRSFYNGDRRIEPPWVLGHEISGEVLEIGPRAEAEVAASGISLGDAVHCISTLWCGRCRMCRSGAENLCLNGELMGFDHPGAYADRVAIPNIALKNLFRIPDGLSPEHATFADPLSDVICGHKDIAIGLDDAVVVIGAGPVGTAHAALARLQGAGEVLMLERAARRLELARDILGDDRMSYIDTSDVDSVRAVMSATGDFGAEVVIVACSSDLAQQEAMEMAAPRGRVMFFGGLPKGTTHIQFPSNVLHYREVQVHGSYASRHRDQVAALDMLAANAGGIRSVVSDVIGLDETPDAFPRIRSGEALKVVVTP